MSLRNLFFLLVCVLIAVFIGVNWHVMNQPTDLSLIFTEIHAPLGVVLVGLMLLLFVVFVSVMAYTQGVVLMESRRHAKEMTAQRELADKAEASRFTELRAHLDKEVGRLSGAIDDHGRETLSRIDRAEMGLRERPIESEIGRLSKAVETHNRDLHSRVDRLEMGLREGLAGYNPALPSMHPAVSHTAEDDEDPVGEAVP